MKKRILFILFLFSSWGALAEKEDNIGFENAAEGWNFYWGSRYYIPIDSIESLNNIEWYKLSDTNRIRILTNENGAGFNDRECKNTNVSTVMGNHFLKLGDTSNDAKGVKATYSFSYSPDKSIIKYGYALILEEPDHEDNERPCFISSISVKRGDSTVETDKRECLSRIYYGDSKYYEGFNKCDRNNTSPYPLLFRDWGYEIIDLKQVYDDLRSGDIVTLSFASFACYYAPHYGYAYVDAEFVNSNFEVDGVGDSVVCVGDTVRFSYPGAGLFVGESYKWMINNKDINSYGSTLQYAFPSEGEYVVSLTVNVINNSENTNACVATRTINQTVKVVRCCPKNPKIILDGFKLGDSYSVCKDSLYHFRFEAGKPMNDPQYEWKFGSTATVSTNEFSVTATKSGKLSVKVTSNECKEGVEVGVDLNVGICVASQCNDCDSRFAPKPGERYVVGGWVSAPTNTSFGNVGIKLSFTSMVGNELDDLVFTPSGEIIDGWQRISGVLTIPKDAEKMKITLINETGSDDVYYDDIRFQPFNSSIKSYVYDPVTMRLVAELDDENYATIYEYDEEGALVRVKKETERGIMTLREARQSSRKVSSSNK